MVWDNFQPFPGAPNRPRELATTKTSCGTNCREPHQRIELFSKHPPCEGFLMTRNDSTLQYTPVSCCAQSTIKAGLYPKMEMSISAFIMLDYCRVTSLTWTSDMKPWKPLLRCKGGKRKAIPYPSSAQAVPTPNSKWLLVTPADTSNGMGIWSWRIWVTGSWDFCAKVLYNSRSHKISQFMQISCKFNPSHPLCSIGSIVTGRYSTLHILDNGIDISWSKYSRIHHDSPWLFLPSHRMHCCLPRARSKNLETQWNTWSWHISSFVIIAIISTVDPGQTPVSSWYLLGLVGTFIQVRGLWYEALSSCESCFLTFSFHNFRCIPTQLLGNSNEHSPWHWASLASTWAPHSSMSGLFSKKHINSRNPPKMPRTHSC